MNSFKLSLITPLFSRGSYETPEIRPPSIRGQLHWWFRALGGRVAEEKQIFGGVHEGAVASRIIVRVSDVQGGTAELPTLPHKRGGFAAAKAAYSPGTSFHLHILERLGGLGGARAAFDRALEAWLLLGTLGLRGTRAAGSFSWEPLQLGPTAAPADFDAYEARCHTLLKGAPLKFALLEKAYASAEQARVVVSDTLSGRDDDQGQNSLSRLNHPLGKIHGGRKTSPLRFRIVQLASQYRIAAIWDARYQVTGNQPADLPKVIDLLEQRKPDLGTQLKHSALSA